MQAKGLASALNQLALNFDGLNNPNPVAHSIMVLLNLLDDVTSELLDMQEAKWEAASKADPPRGLQGGLRNEPQAVSK